MKFEKGVRRIFPFLMVSILLFLCWSIAFLATNWLYQWTEFQPHEWARQLISAFFGFFLFGSCVFIISRFRWMKGRQDEFLIPIIRAMKSISEGNFNIDLSFYNKQFKEEHKEHPYYQIIRSINEMAEKLGEVEEMRQEFISNVSHEIQSPLTSIRGFAHTLRNSNLSRPEREHYLQIIETESNRLSNLSENLLKLTSLEAEHVPLEKREYRLDHQLRRIILANEPQWAEKELNMEVCLKELTICADEEMMEQVWTNLLSNSIKFTPQGGTIIVEVRNSENKKAIVAIQDTGIGMDKEALIHIFERFYKADQSRDRSVAGNGLGLSIVKRILSLHKADIQVYSEIGEGTRIVVEYPGA